MLGTGLRPTQLTPTHEVSHASALPSSHLLGRTPLAGPADDAGQRLANTQPVAPRAQAAEAAPQPWPDQGNTKAAAHFAQHCGRTCTAQPGDASSSQRSDVRAHWCMRRRAVKHLKVQPFAANRPEQMLTLYFAPGSSSMAAHIALHEVGIDFDPRPMSFASKENRSAAYLALNAEGKVPTLLVDGRPLTEVAGILFYLARRFPEAGLLPAADIEAEAQAVSWMSFIAASLHPARRQGLEHSRAVYAVADQRLGGREWVVGWYSIAD